MRVLSVMNQKGGVGKTTVTAALAATAAEGGARVLVIDADPQHDASKQFVDPDTLAVLPLDLTDVLKGNEPITSVMVQARTADLMVVPSRPRLSATAMELVTLMRREERLGRALAAVDGEFDLVLIDCPAGVGMLTINALAAAHDVIVPIGAEDLNAAQGLAALRHTLDELYGDLPQPAVHAVITRWSGDNAHWSTLKAVESQNVSVLGKIPKLHAIHSRAAEEWVPVTMLKPRAERDKRAQRAYRSLARDLGIETKVTA